MALPLRYIIPRDMLRFLTHPPLRTKTVALLSVVLTAEPPPLTAILADR